MQTCEPLADTVPAPPYDSAMFRVASSTPPPHKVRPVRVAVFGSWPKRCGCKREHSAADWSRLPYCGELDDGEAILEMRHCVCGSTIAVECER